MLILNRIYQDLISLFHPAVCPGCGKKLPNRVDWICVECMAEMPRTHFHLNAENPVAQRVKDLNPAVINATSQFYYVPKGRWRAVIHQMKYHKSWFLALKLGYWYGCELRESPLFKEIDMVIAVPLHSKRLTQRRYNQSEIIAAGIANALGVKHLPHAMVRVRNNLSQVKTNSDLQRWNNVDDLFDVAKIKELNGQHLLIVDDVFTTGATLNSCIETLLSKVPSAKISVATIAVSRRHISKL
ncbi:MAG: phosphoribosyltransferase family protein [Rikenellaceae bacterium]